jgi:hypothetical protein
MILDFLRGFGKADGKAEAKAKIKPGDYCCHIETRERTLCLKVHDGMYYGRRGNGELMIGLLIKYEKV